MGSIKQQAVSGVKWNTIATVYCMVVQIVRLAVLTRLLDKSDFGLIAIAMMVIAFTDIFSELGLTVAVLHKQDITPVQYSSVFWTNVILSVFIYVIVFFASPLIASFYQENELSRIIPILSLQIVMNAFGKMFQTIKSKNLEFRFISLVRIISATIGFVVTVILAWIGWGVYSLVFGQLAQIGLTQLVYTISGLKEQKILFKLDIREISDFIKIGIYRLGSQFLDFLASKIDVFLIGKLFGMSDLGIYNLAKELIIKPYTIIYSVINNVASATFAKIQNDIEYVRENYRKLLKLISSISIIIYAAVFVMADVIVSVMYSGEYLEVAPLLRILAFFGFECSISALGGSIQVAYGRTDIGFKWTIVRIAATTLFILVASLFSIQAVAYGQLVISVASLYVYWRLVIFPIIKMPWHDYFGIFKMSMFIVIALTIPFASIAIIFSSNYVVELLLGSLFLIFCFLYFWMYEKDFVVNMGKLLIKNG